MTTWLLLLPAALACEVVAKLLSPVLPMFARPAEGWCDNAHHWAVEPRLPGWLAWFMMDDNSLWGDAGWRTIHCQNHWDSYLGMVLWLWRNSACGFSRSALARYARPMDMVAHGDPDIDAAAGRFGTFRATAIGGPFRAPYQPGQSRLWQYKTAFPLVAGWALQINLGWMMDHALADKTILLARCPYKMSIKLKRVRP